MAGLHPGPARLQRHRVYRPLRSSPPAGGPPAQPRRSRGIRPPDRGERRRQFCHEHQLAGLQRGGLGELPLPDGRVHRPELPLGRHRDLCRACGDAGAHPPVDRPDRELLGGYDPHRPLHPAPACPRCRPPARLPGGHPEPGRIRHGRAADDPHGPGRLPGGDKTPRHERGRVLRRKLSAPLREPNPHHQPHRGLPDPAHPRRPPFRLRPDERGYAAGMGHLRRDARDLCRSPHRPLYRGTRRKPAGGRTRCLRDLHGGKGGQVRPPGHCPLRHLDDRNILRCDRRHARLAHPAWGHGPDAPDPPRRGRLRRGGFGVLHHHRLCGGRRLHRRADDRPDP